MIQFTWRHTVLIALLVCAGVAACQAPQSACDDITCGLLQPVDLTGQWELVNENVTTITDFMIRVTRYTDTPAVQQAKQYLIGTSDPQSETVIVIHDLRRYEPIAPNLDEIHLDAFKESGAGMPFDPNIVKLRNTSQAQCQSSDPNNPSISIILCAAEVRYKHYISIMTFSLSGLTSNDEIQDIMNQVLSKTDQRIQRMEQHLSEMSN